MREREVESSTVVWERLFERDGRVLSSSTVGSNHRVEAWVRCGLGER